jgi:O-antigen/teichoic acid export membrane protein
MLAFFKDWGVNSGMIKYLAQYKSEQNHRGVKNVMFTGTIFELITGGLLTLLCFLMTDFLATSVFLLP